MSIPGDPVGREWIEVSAANPALVDEYRPGLVTFVAFDHDHDAHLVGTGFVTCGNAEMAIVITARHVLDGVARAQRPRGPMNLRLGPHDLRAVWMGKRSSSMLNVVHASCDEHSDLAACIVVPQEVDRQLFVPVSIPLHIVVPVIGQIVHMVSVDKMEVTEHARPMGHDKRGQVLSIERHLSVRLGTVTEVHLNGTRQYKWPCFTTSIPAEPGMSGGLVTLPGHNATVAACGVVSADSFSGSAKADQMQCGNSIIACTWPALKLQMPRAIGGNESPSYRSLLEMVRDGDVPRPVGLGDFTVT